jgi:hypothetical protein
MVSSALNVVFAELKSGGKQRCKLGTDNRKRQAVVACEKFHKALKLAGFTPNGHMRNGKKPPQQVDISKYLGFGLTWALSTLLFLYLGTLADKWLGTEPVLTFVGAFVGAAAGFYYMYLNLVILPRKKDREDEP